MRTFRSRSILPLTAITAALVALAVPGVAAADAGSGTVQRSWISQTKNGPAVSSLDAALPRVYANFVWATPPTPGQRLEIQWRDPTGAVRAAWVNQTISSDSPGTRIFAWIPSAKVTKSPGTWHTVLLVGGVTRSSRAFRMTSGMSLRERLVRAAIADTPVMWRGKARYTLRIGKRYPNYASVLIYPAPGYADVVQEAFAIFKRSGDDWKTITIGGSFACSELPAGVWRDIRVGCGD